MKTIQLSQCKFAIVDDDIYDLVSHLKWFIRSGYASRNFPREENTRLTVYLHHVVIGLPLNGFEIDHIDGNKLNNQRTNLRIVTIRENQSNQIKHRSGKLIGASWHKRFKKWQSSVQINGKLKGLGYFNTEHEAHDAYVKAVAKIKG